MALPTLRSCSAAVIKSSSTDVTPAQPAGLVNGDIVAAAISVGANVQPGKPATFAYEYQSAAALSRPGGNYSWERYAGDTGDPSGSGTYGMSPGSIATASGIAAAFKDCISVGNPWGLKAEATSAGAANTPTVTLPGANYATDDLLVLWAYLSAARTIADPAGWARGSVTASSGLHMWTMRAGSGDVVVPTLALTGGTAQSRMVISSLKKQPATAFAPVIIGGVVNPIAAKGLIVAGAQSSLLSEGSVVGGTFNPRV